MALNLSPPASGFSWGYKTANFDDYPVLIKLRRGAEQYDEFRTKTLFLYVLGKFGFPEQNYVISSEQPPKLTHSQRRVDIVVEDFQDPDAPYTLLFFELKHGRANNTQIAELEAQVSDACHLYFLDNPTKPRIYAMTAYGPKFRIWAFNFSQNQSPVPIYPTSKKMGDKNTYVDVKDGWGILLDKLEYIKANPVPPDELFFGADQTDMLQEQDIIPVRKLKDSKSKESRYETPDGEKLTLPSERWEEAKCRADEGKVVDGFVYYGRSGKTYFKPK